MLHFQISQVFKGHRGAIFSLLPLDENTFLAADGNGAVVQWNTNSPETGLLKVQVPSAILSIARHRHQLWIGTLAGTLYGISLTQLKSEHQIPYFSGSIYIVQYIDNQIITGNYNGKIQILDAENLQILRTISLSTKSIRSILRDTVHKEWIVTCSDSKVYILDDSTFETKQVLLFHQDSVFCAALLHQQRILLLGSKDARLSVWRRSDTDWQLDHVIPAHLFTINDIAVSPSQRVFATASRDKSIKLWSVDNFELLKVMDISKDPQAHLHSVNRLLWLDEHTLLSASDDRHIIQYVVQ
ncbi:MAG: hypothetical protein IPL35_17315 [Sphingobacteriales bacterium]|nr:hypothetical protein [Sphingobacteriales bacterium]